MIVFAVLHCVPPFCNLSAENIDDGEDDDPDGVDEVPVERQHLKPLGVLLLCTQAKEENPSTSESMMKPDDDVRGVQADQRIISGSEEIGVNGEAVVVNEVIPLVRGAGEEDAAQQNRAPRARTCRRASLPLRSAATAKCTVMLLESRQTVAKIGSSRTCAGVGPVRLLPM